MKRRDFLKNSTLASAALLAPSFLQARSLNKSGKIFIVVQLSGGNDGLNTVIPYQNDKYYSLRPQIAVPKNDVLQLTDELGFNPALAPLRELYDESWMSIINNVGYPNPDRSHFRSMDIWQTASGSEQVLTTGWLGRYLDGACEGCSSPHHALELGNELSLTLKGAGRNGFVMSDTKQLRGNNKNHLVRHISNQDAHDKEHEGVSYLYKTLVDSHASTDYLLEQLNKSHVQHTFPDNAFGMQLKQVCQLILAGNNSKVYYVSLSGFDTHAFQQQKQARLLDIYAKGMNALAKELNSHGLWDDTLVMTFSEFGRRVAENGSRGTDHGQASNLFMMGGNLKDKGFVNEGPDLLNLSEGDVRYQIDFRQVYATVLERWLDVSHQQVLGKSFDTLNFI